MTFDEIKSIIIEQYGKQPSTELVDPDYHRYDQYSNIFGTDKSTILNDLNKALGGVTLSNIGEKITSTRLTKIYSANPILNAIKDILEVQIIDSEKEATKKIELVEGRSLILLDLFTMKFLWMMNKASIYGRADESNNINELYCKLFLHFATAINLGFENSFPQPKTPSHQSIEDFSVLTLTTEIQEVFIICHEIAHILLDGKYTLGNTSFNSEKDYTCNYTKFYDASRSIDEELKADELAFEMTLNVFGRESEYAVQAVSLAVFMKIRYFLWLRIVYKDDSEDDGEFIMWFARNNAIRNLINNAYKWGAAIFIIETLEDMEETLEPAALVASDIYKKIIKSINNTTSTFESC